MLKRRIVVLVMFFCVAVGTLGCTKKQETKQEGEGQTQEMQAPQADTTQQAEPEAQPQK